MKNIFYHLVTFSIPKVTKNGQKVPISAKFEFKHIMHKNGNNFTSGTYVIGLKYLKNEKEAKYHLKVLRFVLNFVKC